MAVISLCLTVLAAPMAAMDCADWNSSKYFLVAGVEHVTACLASGADIKARDGNGQTPLHRAAKSNKNSAVITALLDAGADIEARGARGRTPLHLAAGGSWFFSPNPAGITALLAAGADIEARDENGRTPLYRAVRFNKDPTDLTIITALLDAGADPNARNNAWHVALADDKLLEPHDHALSGGSSTPLHQAAIFNGRAFSTMGNWEIPLSSPRCWTPARISRHETGGAERPCIIRRGRAGILPPSSLSCWTLARTSKRETGMAKRPCIRPPR